MYALFIALPVLFLVLSVFWAIRSVKKGRKASRATAIQLLSFLAVCIVSFSVPAIASATTEEDTAVPETTASETADTSADASAKGLGMIAAALAVGIAGVGGGIAVAAAAPAAIGATSEDPKSFGKSIIFVALGEGIALYGLLISILILGKF